MSSENEMKSVMPRTSGSDLGPVCCCFARASASAVSRTSFPDLCHVPCDFGQALDSQQSKARCESRATCGRQLRPAVKGKIGI